MSKITDRYTKLFSALLPSPLTIALCLTLVTFLMAYFFTNDSNSLAYIQELAIYWEHGLWGKDYVNGIWVRSWQLPFMVQMMLILVLGYTLALSQPFDQFIRYFTRFCTNNAKAAFIITFSTILVSFFNWGLGLIFGAVFARKVAEHASERGIKMNYGFLGAAGYVGLMVWHGGLSGSAPLKAAEPGAISKMLPHLNHQINEIPLSATVFSNMNLVISLALLIILPLAMYWLGKKIKIKKLHVKSPQNFKMKSDKIIGVEKLDYTSLFSKLIGLLILVYAFNKAFIFPDIIDLKFITPDFINLTLFGLAFTFHKHIQAFLEALSHAITSASGILIQFPFYFGILGIMKYSGLLESMSLFFVDISTSTSFPLYTFFSAGLVNIFVPSGGGQWAVQGPVIISAAEQLNCAIPKSIMAMAYGDQLTNMLQPFWALPLLGITGLKPKEILPFSLFLLLIGSIIFILGLLSF